MKFVEKSTLSGAFLFNLYQKCFSLKRKATLLFHSSLLLITLPKTSSDGFSEKWRVNSEKVKTSPNFVRGGFWWGKLDSDQRSQRQQIYSLPPLAAREFPHMCYPSKCGMELVNGVEPSTCWLQISCSAIEPHQHFPPPYLSRRR